MASIVPQYRILLFGNTSKKDKKYLNTQWVQKQYQDRKWEKNQFASWMQSTCLGVGLIYKGVWYDESYEKYDWAFGTYMDLFLDFQMAKTPMEAKFGSENVALVPSDWWDKFIKANPEIGVKIKSWQILYGAHLQYYKGPQDLRYKALNLPWGHHVAYHIKTLKNRKNNLNYKIDPANDSRYFENPRCRTCLHLKNRCDVCQATKSKMDKQRCMFFADLFYGNRIVYG